MREMRRDGVVAVVLMVFLSAIVPGAMAADVGTKLGTLYDSGSAASYNFRFVIYQNDTLGLDASRWNFSVCAQPYSSTVTNDSFTVVFYLDDGTVNKSQSVAINAVNDKNVWGTVSFVPADFTANGSATLTVQVKNSTGSVVDTGVYTVGIYESQTAGLVYAVIPVAITIGVLGAILGLIRRTV